MDVRESYEVKLNKLKESLAFKEYELEEAGRKHMADIDRLSE
jgi:hypothetical protein